MEKLLPLLKVPSPERVVVLSSPPGVLARGKKPFVQGSFFKSVSQVAQVVEFERLRPADVEKRIFSQLRETKITIESEAMELLIQLLDGNWGGLELEIAKLVNYVGPEGEITREVVARLCPGYQVFNIFDLAGQIIAGNRSRAMQVLDGLLADGLTPSMIAGELQTHFTNVYLIKGGQPLADGRRSRMISQYSKHGAGYSLEQLEGVICDIAATDAEFRSTTRRPEAALKLLVVRMLGRMERRGE